MRKRGVFVILAITIVVIATVHLFTISRMVNDGKTYKISVPYNGYSTTSFYTKDYVDTGKCVIFIDEWGKKHKICGAYLIEEY